MDRTVHSQTFTDYNVSESLFDSRYTRITQPQQNEDNWFTEQRAYSRSVLAGWGMPLGELPYSADNEQTLRCLVELIELRQKDLQFRSKVKEDIAAIIFQKDKYRSFMEQAQRNLDECVRKLGRTENEASDLKSRNRRTEMQTKKEKDEDRKMIAMLKAKNQQILHDIKKKEQEVNRVKEQMKKSVGEKSLIQAKNSFQIFEGVSPLKREKSEKGEQVKYAFLIQRNDKEMAHLVRQNGMIREKLFQIRENLLDFNQWVDKELFGQSDVDQFKRKTRFPLNHNLLFKKESLVQELAGLMETAKDGILQLRDFYRKGAPVSQKKIRSSELLPSRSQMDQLKFKKKNIKPEALRTDTIRSELIRESKGKHIPIIEKAEDNSWTQSFSPRAHKQVVIPPKQKSPPTPNASKSSNLNKGFKVFESNMRKGSGVKAEEVELPFEDELMSDVVQNQDNSLISHIEVSKLGKNKFDKWDILYQDDD